MFDSTTHWQTLLDSVSTNNRSEKRNLAADLRRIPQINWRCRRNQAFLREFVALLKDLDAYCPAEVRIRVILDNHSAHISKETRAYLATRPNRFTYVHTPKHGSWLNLVETLFGKMAHTFRRQIRVKSKAELRERILLGIKEMNAAPVVHRWKKFDLLIT